MPGGFRVGLHVGFSVVKVVKKKMKMQLFESLRLPFSQGLNPLAAITIPLNGDAGWRPVGNEKD